MRAVRVLLCALLCALQVGAGLAGSSFATLAFGILRARRSRGPRPISDADLTNVLDRFGDVPQLRVAVRAVLQANPIAAVRVSNDSIVVGMLTDRSDKLQVPVGAQALQLLHTGTQMHILVTGIAGDCRALVRIARNTTLNHLHLFGCAPSGRYVALQLGRFLQDSLQAHRAMACHAFVLQPGSRDNNATIYEISPSGGTVEVVAGAAGKGSVAHRVLLEKLFAQCDLKKDAEVKSHEGAAVLATPSEADDCLETMWQRSMENHKVARRFELPRLL